LLTDREKAIASAIMASAGVDIEIVKAVLLRATRAGGEFSQRGLSNAAKLDRDAVYDILKGRNQNPTIATLASIAQALGADLSIFGITGSFVVTEEMLRDALEEHLPHVPAEESPAGQARYLAEAIATALALPRTVPANDLEPPRRRGTGEG
jgi:transcriptional regulator with XRE-family HTH domain